MKLSNFLKFDPEYEGKGLARGNKLEEVIWNEFAHDQLRLRMVVSAIQDNYQLLDSASWRHLRTRLTVVLHKIAASDRASTTQGPEKVSPSSGIPRLPAYTLSKHLR